MSGKTDENSRLLIGEIGEIVLVDFEPVSTLGGDVDGDFRREGDAAREADSLSKGEDEGGAEEQRLGGGEVRRQRGLESEDGRDFSHQLGFRQHGGNVSELGVVQQRGGVGAGANGAWPAEVEDDGVDGGVADVLDGVLQAFAHLPGVGRVCQHRGGAVGPRVQVDASRVQVAHVRQVAVHGQLLPFLQKGLEHLHFRVFVNQRVSCARHHHLMRVFNKIFRGAHDESTE